MTPSGTYQLFLAAVAVLGFFHCWQREILHSPFCNKEFMKGKHNLIIFSFKWFPVGPEQLRQCDFHLYFLFQNDSFCTFLTDTYWSSFCSDTSDIYEDIWRGYRFQNLPPSDTLSCCHQSTVPYKETDYNDDEAASDKNIWHLFSFILHWISRNLTILHINGKKRDVMILSIL